MKREDIFQAIGDVDDDLLEEAAAPAGAVVWRWISGIVTAAACAAVVLGAAGLAYSMHRPETRKDDPAVSGESGAAGQTAPSGEETLTPGESMPETAVPSEIPQELPQSAAEQSTAAAEQHPSSGVQTAAVTETMFSTTSQLIVENEAEADAESDQTSTVPAPEVPWMTAYRELMDERSDEAPVRCSLIDINGDEVPELVLNRDSELCPPISLYTYADGQLYTLMDSFSWGTSGNIGYYYVPGENLIVYRSYENAGLHVWYQFCRIGADNSLEYFKQVECVYFDDDNGNHAWDEGEEETAQESLFFLDGDEITEEEAQVYEDYVFGSYPLLLGEDTCEDVAAQMYSIWAEP